MRQVRKGGKSGRECISRVKKSTTKRDANRADPSSTVKPANENLQFFRLSLAWFLTEIVNK